MVLVIQQQLRPLWTPNYSNRYFYSIILNAPSLKKYKKMLDAWEIALNFKSYERAEKYYQ